MRLADELRMLKIREDLIERAQVLESSFENYREEMTRANTPVADVKCRVTLTDSGWYEWVIDGVKCEYGYVTWREAHEAGRVILVERERNNLSGKIRGAVLYLRALSQALGGSIVVEKLKRTIVLLEEGYE